VNISVKNFAQTRAIRTELKARAADDSLDASVAGVLHAKVAETQQAQFHNNPDSIKEVDSNENKPSRPPFFPDFNTPLVVDVSNRPPVTSMSIQDLDAEAKSIRIQIALVSATGGDTSALWQRLSDVNNELERRALDELETYMVETDVNGDSILTRDELLQLQSQASQPPTALDIAVNFYLNNPERFAALDVAGTVQDAKIGLADIHARQLQINADVDNVDATGGTNTYNAPTPGGSTPATIYNYPPRDQGVYDNQQDAIEEAMRTGEPVSFVNSQGEILTVSVLPSVLEARGRYEVVINGKSMYVTSEISLEDTIAGIANVVEFGSTMGVQEGIRQYPDHLVFKKGPRADNPLIGADYDNNHEMVFYHGNQYIDEQGLYYHEIAHGINHDFNTPENTGTSLSYEEQPPTAGSFGYVPAWLPPGWPEVYAQAVANGNLVSNYAGESPSEAFAEAYAAYMHAKSHGPAALQEFREQFPLQAGFIDETIFGITPT